MLLLCPFKKLVVALPPFSISPNPVKRVKSTLELFPGRNQVFSALEYNSEIKHPVVVLDG